MPDIRIDSEIGRLRTVIVHEPGAEIENVTPDNAAESLFDDLLFLERARDEHRHLTLVLEGYAQVLRLTELLRDILEDRTVASRLVTRLCELHGATDRIVELVELPKEQLSTQLIKGTPIRRNSLANHLDPGHFALPPLPNAFFMRDATMCVNDRVIVGSMASRIRSAEAIILRAIFQHHPALQGDGFYFDGTQRHTPEVTVEGGDVLVLRKDLVVVGWGERTSVAAIDVLLESLARVRKVTDVVVVELPKTRATIHLDMIFTMVDKGLCVISPPLVTGMHRCRAHHVHFDGGKISHIAERQGLLEALDILGMPLDPIPCGGEDRLRQSREQWASGANFFALAPGKIIGFERNRATFERLAAEGFEIVRVSDIASGNSELHRPGRVAYAMPGAELNRGGGGCRCMTLPVTRDPVRWDTSKTTEEEEHDDEGR